MSQQVDLFGNLIKENNWIIDNNYIPVARPTKFTTENMQRKAAMLSSARQDWRTDINFYKYVCKERGLNDGYYTDPATGPDNPLGCKLFYTKEQDGLTQDWKKTIFINPPFGFGYYRGKWSYITGLWIKEAWERVNTDKDPDVELVTMIIPARTDTKAFHTYIYKQPNVKIEFLKGRLKFGDSKMVAPFPSMLVDFRRP